MIHVSHLVKTIQGQMILDDISFDVARAEILVVLGESGAGKSVLLKHLIGLLKPDKGVIEIEGRDITKLPEEELLRQRQQMGYLFQEGALYDFMNVFDNLAFPLREHTSFDSRMIAIKVEEILKMVGLEAAKHKYPSELSGGMRKRVGLARAMIMDAKILLCDEPTSGLDPIRSRDISDLIRQVSRRYQCATVITSHDIDNAFRIADRIAIIQQGKIVIIGTPQALKSSENHFVQEFIS
ncbi:MAG TPA: ATP-binding cassette domain-containing protein [Candidatus Omnitrophota bacterium]|nr:ATP-binding cassette domain-containing protein [Candidatus Omnitrophota bacterium]